MNVITKTIDVGNGREISVETGKLAKQADGSVVARSLKDSIDVAKVMVAYPELWTINRSLSTGSGGDLSGTSRGNTL